MKLLFLDIDGVLNRHKMNKAAGCSGLHPQCVKHFNSIIRATECRIVVSSAWRYIAAAGDMTVRGFEYMLRTHGVTKDLVIDGITIPDELCVHCGEKKRCDLPCRSCKWQTTRGDQIRFYLKSRSIKSHVVLDDMDLGIRAAGLQFVHVVSRLGLTEIDAENAIAALMGGNQK